MSACSPHPCRPKYLYDTMRKTSGSCAHGQLVLCLSKGFYTAYSIKILLMYVAPQYISVRFMQETFPRPRSFQQVLKQAAVRAGIRKPVTLHWLRHSYATHLLEAGTNLRYIQEILGHNSPKTTQIYTHVRTEGLQNIISPFDSL